MIENNPPLQLVDAGEMILSELMETCQNCQNSEIGRSFVNKVTNTKNAIFAQFSYIISSRISGWFLNIVKNVKSVEKNGKYLDAWSPSVVASVRLVCGVCQA